MCIKNGAYLIIHIYTAITLYIKLNKGNDMNTNMKIRTKLKSRLIAEDFVLFAMTDEEFDERANRLAFKALNGIVDEETIEADKRFYRNRELLYGKAVAKKMNALDKKYFI